MMADSDSGLEAPVLLLAMPQVLDPFFHRSVVLLMHHSEEGSFGFIVNRPTRIRVSEIMRGMELRWQGDGEALAFFGGPVQPQQGSVLFDKESSPLDPEEEQETTTEAAPSLLVTQHLGDLEQLGRRPSKLFRLFLGYAGWGAGQLVEEILRNDWLTAPVSSDLIFRPEAEEVWEAALQSVGVDPATLPSWTAAGTDESTN